MTSCVADPTFRSERRNTSSVVNADSDFHITLVEDGLLPDERQYLIGEQRTYKEERSMVSKNGKDVRDKSRTSRTTFLEKSSDSVVECIEHKIASMAGRPHSHLESLQITRYKRNQEYRPHFDAFDAPRDNGGQRTTTVFTYLKGIEDERCGGTTFFPNATAQDGTEGVHVRPKTGHSVVWENTDTQGEIVEKSLHGGMKVTCNVEKIGLNAWFGNQPWDEEV